MTRSASGAVHGGAQGFAARSTPAKVAQRAGVSPSYFTRLILLSYLARHYTQAILEGHQPRGLTGALASVAGPEQRTVLGFA